MAQNSVLGEDMDNEELGELFHYACDNYQNEDCLFGEAVNYYQNGIRAIEVQKWLYEVHGDGVP